MTFDAVSIGWEELPTSEVAISTKRGHLNGAHARTRNALALPIAALSGSRLNYESSLLILERRYLANGDEAEAL